MNQSARVAPPEGHQHRGAVGRDRAACPFRAGSRVDLRTVPGDATTSVVFGGAKALQDGRAALMADDSFEGKPAVLVLLSIDGTILAKVPALVGG